MGLFAGNLRDRGALAVPQANGYATSGGCRQGRSHEAGGPRGCHGRWEFRQVGGWELIGWLKLIGQLVVEASGNCSCHCCREPGQVFGSNVAGLWETWAGRWVGHWAGGSAKCVGRGGGGAACIAGVA